MMQHRLLPLAAALIAGLAVNFCELGLARAQDSAYGEARRWQPKVQYPTWGAEVRFGIYRPVLATEGTAARIRELMFDDSSSNFFGKHPILFGLEFNWYPLRTFGLAGLYGRVSYHNLSAPGRLCTEGNVAGAKAVNCNATTVFESFTGSDTQTLHTLPLSLGIIYRYDILRRNLNVPIIISGKVGLDYNVWWATLGTGAAHTPANKVAQGGILGWSGALSVGYAFDGGSSHAPAYGTNSHSQDTYIFLEYMVKDGRQLFVVDNPQKPRLDLSDYTIVNIGMLLHFN